MICLQILLNFMTLPLLTVKPDNDPMKSTAEFESIKTVFSRYVKKYSHISVTVIGIILFTVVNWKSLLG